MIKHFSKIVIFLSFTNSLIDYHQYKSSYYLLQRYKFI